MDTSANLPEVLSLWKIAGDQDAAEFSFSLQAESLPAASLWQMDLSADPGVAAEQLARTERQLLATQNALAVVPIRLERFVNNIATSQNQPASFSSPAGGVEGDASLSPAEEELLRWLETTDPGQVSFGLGALHVEDITQAGQQFRQMVENLTNSLVHLAWVETKLAGRLLARTIVGWTGDTETIWGIDTPPSDQLLHQRSLKLALASRITMLRLFIVVTQGAAKLSALIATPGGALLAMPAAWKFITNLLAELEKYQELTQEEQGD